MGAQGLVSKEKIRGQYDGTCAPALPTRCSLLFWQGDGWQVAMRLLPNGCGVDPTCLAAMVYKSVVCYIPFWAWNCVFVSVLQLGSGSSVCCHD